MTRTITPVPPRGRPRLGAIVVGSVLALAAVACGGQAQPVGEVTGGATPTGTPSTATAPTPDPSPPSSPTTEAASPAVAAGTSMPAGVVQILTEEDGVPGDLFGSVVDTDGRTVVVGSPGRDDGVGAAVVFGRAGDRFEQVAVLRPPEGTPAGSGFGHDVSVDGDVIAVSAPWQPSSASVHIYERVHGVWEPTHEAQPPNGSPGAFGWAVAVDSYEVVVGAPPADEEAGPGRAYVYAPPQGGPWTQLSELTAPDPDRSALFGEAVDIDNSNVVVGAPSRAGEPGSAHVFGYAAGYRHVTTLTGSDEPESSLFGNAVAITVDPDRYLVGVTVGAPGDDGAGEGAGAIYRYDRDADEIWRESTKMTTQAPGDPAGARFGTAVDMAGLSTHVIGAGGAGDSAGYVEIGLPDGTRIVDAPDPAGSVFGFTAAIADDIALVGAPRADADTGAVYVLAAR